VKLRIRLENSKGVFARVWYNIAITSYRLSPASVERQKLFVVYTQAEKFVTGVHVTSRNQGVSLPKSREAEERDTGKEVALQYYQHTGRLLLLFFSYVLEVIFFEF